MTTDRTVSVHEPEGWPRPSGFSTAVSAAGRLVFVSGQIGWDPRTLEVASNDFVTQVRRALENVVAALAGAGAKPTDVTRLTWYITDRETYMTQRRAIGEHYREVIGRHFPAMSVVVVKELLEVRAKVEIEATAVVGRVGSGLES